MATLYLDESKAKNYIFVGVVVADGDSPRLRKRVAALKMPGQRSIHFVKEGNSRRKRLLSEFRDLEVQALKIVSYEKNKLNAREECIREIVAVAMKHGCTSIFFERDESVVSKDESWLKDELAKARPSQPIGFEHLQRHEEPILWVADALAWCDARAGEWSERIKPLIIEVYKTKP